ncbi:tetratricopeptide repeat protein [Erythrobacter sp. JK5]|uniref:tetratricopeptide repeat protein n=1 Tax=Erythrobacter sp. JK5 TaxID=2829500 RepID=UPI001BA9F0AA|nr:tetratricopeptide repeat protein [Erythrobacter sp. JK5]QUL36892.1 tetratricopeptide repeat protein [Erythrobacter sp. JK5]
MTEEVEGRYLSIVETAKSDPEFALNEAENILKDHKEYALSWHARSYVYLVMGKYEKAAHDIRQAILIEPNKPRGYLKADRIEIKQKNFERAAAHFGQIIECDNKEHRERFIDEALFFRAYYFTHLKRFDAALNDLERIESVEEIWIDGLQTKNDLILDCRRGLGGIH